MKQTAFVVVVVVPWNYDHSCYVMCFGKEYSSDATDYFYQWIL